MLHVKLFIINLNKIAEAGNFNFGHLGCQNSLHTQECQATTYLPTFRHQPMRSQLPASQPMRSQFYLSIYLFWKIVNIFFFENLSIYFLQPIFQPILQPIVNLLSSNHQSIVNYSATNSKNLTTNNGQNFRSLRSCFFIK